VLTWSLASWPLLPVRDVPVLVVPVLRLS